jgi:hypothetical protein
MDASEKQLECQICFEDFHADFAFIPELDCSCTIIVHEECWEQWSGLCLYCRNREYEVEEPIYIVTSHNVIGYSNKILIVYFLWSLIFIMYGTLFYNYYTRDTTNQTQP